MANTMTPDSRQTSGDLRRRLTMPTIEPVQTADSSIDADLEPFDSLRALTRQPSVSQNTPLPKENLKAREILKSPVPPAAAPATNRDIYFPETKDSKTPPVMSGDVEQLQSENYDLRELLNEMRHLLQEANDSETRRKAELEQKNAQLAELQQILQSLEEQVTAIHEAPKAKNVDELEEWSDELERENIRLSQLRRDLDAERKQIRDDERDLQRQMRDVEVSMAKERAVMARQETELRRLNAEIQQELELMQRGDPALRMQMMQFHRRHQDIVARAGAAPAGPTALPPMAQAFDSPDPLPPMGTPPANGNGSPDSSMFRRLFRNGNK